MEPVTLQDDRLLLRAHRASDLDDVVAMCRDPEFARWTTVPQPYERHHAAQFCLVSTPQAWADGTGWGWAIEHRGRFAGNIDLRPDGSGSVGVGFGLARWARGRELVPAALRLAVGWAFTAVGQQVLRWDAMVGNWSSRRAAWKVGVRVEGVQRSGLAARGVRHDAWTGSLLRGEPMQPAHPWFAVPTLEDGVVRLRRWRDADAAQVVSAGGDPVSRHWLAALPDPYDETTAREFISSREEEHAGGRGLHWCVADVTDDQCLGSLSLMGVGGAGGARHAEVGYWTVPSARRRGVMARAVRLAADHAFAPAQAGLGLDRLTLLTARDNVASQRVAVAAGFTRTGVARAAERLGDGTVSDLVTYDRLRGDPQPRLG